MTSVRIASFFCAQYFWNFASQRKRTLFYDIDSTLAQIQKSYKNPTKTRIGHQSWIPDPPTHTLINMMKVSLKIFIFSYLRS